MMRTPHVFLLQSVALTVATGLILGCAGEAAKEPADERGAHVQPAAPAEGDGAGPAAASPPRDTADWQPENLGEAPPETIPDHPGDDPLPELIPEDTGPVEMAPADLAPLRAEPGGFTPRSLRSQPSSLRAPAEPVALREAPPLDYEGAAGEDVPLRDSSAAPPESASDPDGAATFPEPVAPPPPFSDSEKTKEQKDDPSYRVVKVFYGTDRARVGGPDYSRWFYLGGSLAIFGAAIGVFAGSMKSKRQGCAPVFLAFAGFGVAAYLAVIGGWDWAFPPPVEQAVEITYGGDRGDLTLGVAEVSIPANHTKGTLEAPTIFKLEFEADPFKHVTLLKVQERAQADFYHELNEFLETAERQQCLVFVHGYNTGFTDAVRRTAQLCHDLKFPGAPVCYTWPSQGTLLGYQTDETNVAWTEADFEKFLLDLRERSGAEAIHIIAHSMGNRAVTETLKNIALSQKHAEPLFGEVVLTAPDVDADHYRRNLADHVKAVSQRVTLYASSNDRALLASEGFHGAPRLGDSGDTLVILPTMETIDVSAVDTSLLGHAYYGSNGSVISDLHELIASASPPSARAFLAPRNLGLLSYWAFESPATGSREGGGGNAYPGLSQPAATIAAEPPALAAPSLTARNAGLAPAPAQPGEAAELGERPLDRTAILLIARPEQAVKAETAPINTGEPMEAVDPAGASAPQLLPFRSSQPIRRSFRTQRNPLRSE